MLLEIAEEIMAEISGIWVIVALLGGAWILLS